MIKRINDKHPRGLTTIFFTEMWERFSYYGMRALLTLYLTLQLFNDLQDPVKKSKAFAIYAAYCALVYATPFIGGMIADRLLGFKKAVIFGAVMMAIGHFVMAIESEFMLYIALAFLIIGNGFFKPNMSSMVGGLYEENDPRRDSGYTIFYMGINIGALLAPIVCGVVGETLGWHYGFGLAGFGMITGLLMFKKNKFKLGAVGDPPEKTLLKKHFAGIPVEWVIYLCSFFAVALVALLVRYYEAISYILFVLIILFISIIIIKAIKSEKIVRQRLWVVLIMLVFSTLFWAFFEQAGSSLTLFANENVNRSFLGMQLPASLFQSVNPLFIIVFAPLFSMFWMYLAKRSMEPSIPVKFALALLQVGVGFFILVFAARFITVKQIITDPGTQLLVKAAVVPMSFLILAYFFHTTGELCLSPIGLSMVTKLSPKKITGMVMGAWFLSSALAHHSAGFIANMTTGDKYISPKEIAVQESINYIVTENSNKSFDDEIKKQLSYVIQPGINEAWHYIRQQCETIVLNDSLKLKNSILNAAIVKATDSINTRALTGRFPGLNIKPNSMFTIALKKSVAKYLDNTRQANIIVNNASIVEFETSNRCSINIIHSYKTLVNYLMVFKKIGWISVISAFILFILTPWIKKMMHGIH